MTPEERAKRLLRELGLPFGLEQTANAFRQAIKEELEAIAKDISSTAASQRVLVERLSDAGEESLSREQAIRADTAEVYAHELRQRALSPGESCCADDSKAR